MRNKISTWLLSLAFRLRPEARSVFAKGLASMALEEKSGTLEKARALGWHPIPYTETEDLRITVERAGGMAAAFIDYRGRSPAYGVKGDTIAEVYSDALEIVDRVDQEISRAATDDG